MHRSEKEQGASLREWRAVEERQDLLIVGDGTADGGVGGAAVPFDGGGKAPEVVGQGLLDEHAARSWRGGAG